jgi:hypothetical protein
MLTRLLFKQCPYCAYQFTRTTPDAYALDLHHHMQHAHGDADDPVWRDNRRLVVGLVVVTAVVALVIYACAG